MCGKAILRTAIMAMALTGWLTAGDSVAQETGPAILLQPVLDEPLRDAAITRGPDGMFYLTGVLQGRNQNGELDFDNSRQIKLWKSKNLKNWEEIGVVFDLDHPRGDFERGVRWLRQSHKNPCCADSPVVHGVKSPELHIIRGDWYICFSINDQGTGLLKSASGKPEGPYECLAQITLRGGDPTMFWDEKNEWGGTDKVYWLFGGGWIAEMNNDLTAIVEQPRLLTCAHQRPPRFAQGKAPEWHDYPLTVGDHGVFMFKLNGRYYLTAAERTNRMNASCDDTFIAWADSVMGPYSMRQMMAPHGGGITVFPGPRSSAVPKYYHEQQRFFLGSVSAQQRRTPEQRDAMKKNDTLYVSFSGNDVRAVFRDRPAFLPLEWTGPERHVQQFEDVDSFPRKPRHVITERGPWPWMKPLVNERVRDLRVLVAPNGKYYFSGAILSQPGKMYVWESDDLATWRRIGPVWTYEQIDWLPEKLEMPKDRYPENPTGNLAWNHIFWHTWINWIGDNFYITYVIFGPNDERLNKLSGLAVIRSTTGKIEGPYESLGRIGGQYGQSPEPSYPEFFRVDGQLWVGDWVNWRPVVAKVDESKLHTRAGWNFDWKPVDAGVYEQMFRGDTYNTLAIAGRPFFYFMSGGRLDLKEVEIGNNTYDHHYVELQSPLGPPKIGARPQVVPHNGQANVFQDHQGRWWSSMFGSDDTAPWSERFGLIALRVEEGKDGFLRIDVEDQPDDDQKRIMGGGQIAEVQTVQETLP